MEGFREFFRQQQKTTSEETFEEIKKYFENFENKIKLLVEKYNLIEKKLENYVKSIKANVEKIKSDL
jgi:predicted  nucleic acid-binding Zn-ribbon protein